MTLKNLAYIKLGGMTVIKYMLVKLKETLVQDLKNMKLVTETEDLKSKKWPDMGIKQISFKDIELLKEVTKYSQLDAYESLYMEIYQDR